MVGKFVEEALRLQGSAHFRPRRATADTELGGVQIKKGDMVIAIMMAANRDPNVYECPHSVALDRTQLRKHLAFISGPRSCPGAGLARVEMVESIQLALERFPDLKLADGADKASFVGFTLRSYNAVPVHVGAAAAG
jgi:cytochrome P450